MPVTLSKRNFWLYAGVFAIGGAVFATQLSAHADPAARVPAPAYDPPGSGATETATLSGGCFWGLQGVYEHVKGVEHVYAGYTGGTASTAQYETVSTGTTGHAESVQITFNPKVISYAKILEIYFTTTTDPTELNYQGPDTGTQYRSEIWYASPAQQEIATDYIAQLTKGKVFSSPIVVRVDPAKPFYHAEDYHQDFLVTHPDYPYIVFNDLPKVKNLQALLPQFYQDKPDTVFPVS
jgi:peptide-methionine (S)-S-oxide reductase